MLTHPRKAMTLVELLVVVVILVLLVGVVLPLIQPALRGREVREAARQLNALFAAAQARAMESGRPVGVLIERDNDTPGPRHDNQRAFRLVIAKAPLVYAGEALSAVSTVSTSIPPSPWKRDLYYADWQKIARDDLIRFGYRQPLYRITDAKPGSGNGPYNELVPTDNPAIATITFAPRFNGPISAPPQRPLPYQIYRMPRTLRPTDLGTHRTLRGAAAPLELPLGTYIDLTWSGTQLRGRFVDDDRPIVVTFSPTGAVDFVLAHIDTDGDPSTWELEPHKALDNLYFLIGRSKRGLSNQNLVADAGSLWLTIDHRTGRVTTSENLGVGDFVPVNWTDADKVERARRASTATAENMGGR
jgi:type II secretory pathway pseudopilin PulG